MKLYEFVLNFYIHVSVSNLCIPTTGPQTQYSQIGGRSEGIYPQIYLNAETRNEAAQHHFLVFCSIATNILSKENRIAAEEKWHWKSRARAGM